MESSSIERAARGGYVVHECGQGEDLTIVSSGSEVSIAIAAAGILENEGKKVRVVSLPCWEVFDAQDQEYRLSVLRSGAPVLSVEAYSVRPIDTQARVKSTECGFVDHWVGTIFA